MWSGSQKEHYKVPERPTTSGKEMTGFSPKNKKETHRAPVLWQSLWVTSESLSFSRKAHDILTL